MYFTAREAEQAVEKNVRVFYRLPRHRITPEIVNLLFRDMSNVALWFPRIPPHLLSEERMILAVETGAVLESIPHYMRTEPICIAACRRFPGNAKWISHPTTAIMAALMAHERAISYVPLEWWHQSEPALFDYLCAHPWRISEVYRTKAKDRMLFDLARVCPDMELPCADNTSFYAKICCVRPSLLRKVPLDDRYDTGRAVARMHGASSVPWTWQTASILFPRKGLFDKNSGEPEML